MSAHPHTDWLITFLVDSSGLVFSHDPYCIGAFELSLKPEPFPECERALAASARSHSITLSDRTLRMRTFFLDAAEEDVVRQGRLYAQEALVLFGYTVPFTAAPELLRAGCLFDLSTGMAKPIPQRPQQKAYRRSMGIVAIFDEVATHPAITVNSLLSTSPETYGELGRAVRRSAHWSHLAAQADDYGERLLLRWMAAETLTRESDGESLTPKLTAAAGFPESRYELSLPAAERAALSTVTDFSIWKKRLKALFEKLREARNKIAHSGFRELDLGDYFSEQDQLVLRRVLPRVVYGLQRMALNALQLGIRTMHEMWSRFGECFLLHRPPTLAKDLEGNLLFSLAQPEDPFDE